MKNLSLLRKESNMSQLELAEVLGVSQQTISKYEKGIREPDNSTLIRLSNIFDCSIDYLLDKSNIKKDNYTYQFTSAEEAVKFILEQPTLMAYGGYDLKTMSDDEIIDIANDLLYALRLSIERRKKK